MLPSLLCRSTFIYGDGINAMTKCFDWYIKTSFVTCENIEKDISGDVVGIFILFHFYTAKEFKINTLQNQWRLVFFFICFIQVVNTYDFFSDDACDHGWNCNKIKFNNFFCIDYPLVKKISLSFLYLLFSSHQG